MMQILLNTTARSILATTALLTVVACSPEGGFGQFYREAGSQLDQGEFGNATLHNQLAQTCKTNGVGGGKVGTAAADPLVVLDPKSTPTRKVYRVHCDGKLDGKYAQIIYRDYVTSAGQKTVVDTADVEAE